MLAALTFPYTRELLISSAASIVPSNSLKRPWTVAIIMCFTSNATLECVGSTCQVPVGTRTIPCSVWSWVAMVGPPGSFGSFLGRPVAFSNAPGVLEVPWPGRLLRGCGRCCRPSLISRAGNTAVDESVGAAGFPASRRTS